MKKIKVLIFSGFGSSGYPKHISEQIKETNFPESRCGSIIEILELYPDKSNIDNLQEKYNSLQIGEVLRNKNKFYFGKKPYNISCSIVEVDTSKRWTIDEYDGAEGIKYLEPICVSKELNYWKE